MKLCGKWSRTVKNGVEVPYGIHAGRSGRYTAGAFVLQAAVTVATPDGAIGCSGCRGGRRGVSWRVIEPVERREGHGVLCVQKLTVARDGCIRSRTLSRSTKLLRLRNSKLRPFEACTEFEFRSNLNPAPLPLPDVLPLPPPPDEA